MWFLEANLFSKLLSFKTFLRFLRFRFASRIQIDFIPFHTCNPVIILYQHQNQKLALETVKRKQIQDYRMIICFLIVLIQRQSSCKISHDDSFLIFLALTAAYSLWIIIHYFLLWTLSFSLSSKLRFFSKNLIHRGNRNNYSLRLDHMLLSLLFFFLVSFSILI